MTPSHLGRDESPCHDEPGTYQRNSNDLQKAVSRRSVIKTAVVAAAAGAATGSVLSGAVVSAAAGATTTGNDRKTTGRLGTPSTAAAPAVVYLVDRPTIRVDASLGNDFRVKISGDRRMGRPSNPVDGQKIIFQITQGAGGRHTITWQRGYAFSASLPQPDLSTRPGDTDLLGFIYNKALDRWLLAAYVKGFA